MSKYGRHGGPNLYYPITFDCCRTLRLELQLANACRDLRGSPAGGLRPGRRGLGAMGSGAGFG